MRRISMTSATPRTPSMAAMRSFLAQPPGRVEDEPDWLRIVQRRWGKGPASRRCLGTSIIKSEVLWISMDIMRNDDVLLVIDTFDTY